MNRRFSTCYASSKVALFCAVVLSFGVALSGCSGNSGGISTPTVASTPSYIYPAAPATEAIADYNGIAAKTWPTSANGNVPPSTNIVGAATGFNQPAGIAFDSAGKMFVADRTSTIKVYAAGATGNVAPSSTISIAGPNNFSGITLDSSNNVYATDCATGSVTVFAAGASGVSLPIRSISGAATGMTCPYQVAIDSTGRIGVVNVPAVGNVVLLIFAANASGNVAPVQTIAGAATQLNDADYGIAFAPNGTIYASGSNAAGTARAILQFPATASGNVAPSNAVTGAATQLNYPGGLAFDAAGTLYVADSKAASGLLTFAPGATGNAAPTRQVAGPATTILSASAVAVH